MPKQTAVQKAASALGKKRWEDVSPEQRSQWMMRVRAQETIESVPVHKAAGDGEKRNPAAARLGQSRWAGVSEKERRKHMKLVRQAPGSGRPRVKDRCYCGANSRKRAISRAFDCCKHAGKYPTGKIK